MHIGIYPLLPVIIYAILQATYHFPLIFLKGERRSEDFSVQEVRRARVIQPRPLPKLDQE